MRPALLAVLCAAALGPLLSSCAAPQSQPNYRAKKMRRYAEPLATSYARLANLSGPSQDKMAASVLIRAARAGDADMVQAVLTNYPQCFTNPNAGLVLNRATQTAQAQGRNDIVQILAAHGGSAAPEAAAPSAAPAAAPAPAEKPWWQQ